MTKKFKTIQTNATSLDDLTDCLLSAIHDKLSDRQIRYRNLHLGEDSTCEICARPLKTITRVLTVDGQFVEIGPTCTKKHGAEIVRYSEEEI